MKISKKVFFLISIFCFLFQPIIAFAVSDIGGGGSGSAGSVSGFGQGGFKQYQDMGVRVTIYDESGKRVSNSVDVVFSENVYNRFLTYGKTHSTLDSHLIRNKGIGKIEYINGSVVEWDESSLEGKIVVEQNHSTEDAASTPKTFPGNLLKENASYWYDNIDIKNQKYVPVNVMNKLQACTGDYHCEYGQRYYAVFEPTFYVWFNYKKYYGTAYELAYEFMSNDKTAAMKNGAYALDGWVNNKIPRMLVISGEYKTFYNNVHITKYCEFNEKNKNNYWETCLSYGTSHSLAKESILNKGVGMSVYDWTEILQTRKNLTCGVDVSINECGESSIYEAFHNGKTNNKECIVDNAAYSYIEGCNLYCSDKITTNFSGFYGNFRGNNVFGAIRSGKYLSIKSNPKITVEKTCYQSKTSNECPNVIESLKSTIKKDKANKIYLTVDGRKYDLIGTESDPIIKLGNDDKIEAIITYEYKLDENINKYIDIGTMKGILNPNDKTYNNDGPTIITSKGTFGRYKYGFDVSETPLNKYTSSSPALRELTNTEGKNPYSDKYNFINTITINYNSASGKKNNYTNDDLKNTACTYVKYNPDEGCICPENKCCDSITCEVLEECPPDPDGNDCTCTGKYGCYDDGKCTPIPDPTPGDKDGECDPDKKVCFPDVIYRPISLVEPFPGINGDKRTPGNNWNKIIKTSNGKVYSYGDYYIRNRRGYKDYEIYQAEPLYVIKLDGAKIQAIRKYNDKHNYNDFELTCINGENCISKFLRGAAQDFSINLIESGTCKNINNYNFNSCIKNKGE